MNLLTYSETERTEKLYRIYTKFPKVIKIWFLELLYYLDKLNLERLKTPNVITFYVTFKCNARCKHCFVWRELNKKDVKELTLTEIEKIFSGLTHPLSRLTLTGGEAYLRDDIIEISKILSKNNCTKKLWLPTNGLETERIYKVTEKIIKYTKIPFVVTVSIQGLEETHNEIMGIKNAFQQTVRTVNLLKQLMRKYNNFQVRVLTTISNRNLNEIEKLIDFVQKKLEVFPHINFIWGSKISCYSIDREILSDLTPPTEEIGLPSLGQLININKKIDDKVGKQSLLSRIESTRRKYIIEIIKNKKRLFPCVASLGRNAIIYPNGDVSFCEFTKAIGNLRDFDYKFSLLYNSKSAEAIRSKLKNCACNSPYYLTRSMLNNLNVLKEIIL